MLSLIPHITSSICICRYEDALVLLKDITSTGPWGSVHVSCAPPFQDIQDNHVCLSASTSASAASACTSQSEIGGSGSPHARPSWADISTRDIILQPPALLTQIQPTSTSTSDGESTASIASIACSIVEGLNLPEVDRRAASIMVPVNGRAGESRSISHL